MNESAATTAETKRGPGRPPKETSVEITVAPLKKGNSTWKPANVLDVFDKEPGYRYRVAEKSPRNIAKKQREGWEIVSGIQSPTTGNNTGNYMDKGKPMTSVLEGYDYVIMRIPEELALQRDDFFNGESNRRISALKRDAQKDIGGKGEIHGTITMEKKGIRNIIKD